MDAFVCHSESKEAEKKEAEKKEIGMGKEAAIAAEIEAARHRAQMPFDERVNAFRLMLSQKKISVFSTFEKELSKIVFDPRYLLLSSRERKQVFDDFCR